MNELPIGDFSDYDMSAIKPELAKLNEGSVYLEVGVQYGRSLAFAKFNSKADVYGIDPRDINEFKDATFINLPSNEAVKDWNKDIDLLFIDGDHSYQGVKDDWDNFSPFVKVGGIVFFHDCDDCGMEIVKFANEMANDNGWGELVNYKTPECNTSMASLGRIE